MLNDNHPQLSLPPGKYIVAVSGGVDSVVLLNMLSNMPNVELIIAHFDHGIRGDSADDAKFVAKLAKSYGMPFETQRIELGPETSEAEARDARYAFLKKVQKKYHASAILTAHHQDDVLETVVINLTRGTGRRGLSSLKSSEGVIRPLLHMTKADLSKYAEEHSLTWREDSTNTDTKYLRNRIRHELLPKAGEDWRRQMLGHVHKAHEVNQKLEREIEGMLSRKLVRDQAAIQRKWFVGLPHSLATEVVHALLRKLSISDIDRHLIERLTIGIKTAAPGKKLDIDKNFYLLLTKRSARIMERASGKTARV